MSESMEDVLADFKSYAEQLCLNASADDALDMMPGAVRSMDWERQR